MSRMPGTGPSMGLSGERRSLADAFRLRHHAIVGDAPNPDLHRQIDARLALLENGIRRAAVVDDGGRLLGLLCLKRHGNGFCTDA